MNYKINKVKIKLLTTLKHKPFNKYSRLPLEFALWKKSKSANSENYYNFFLQNDKFQYVICNNVKVKHEIHFNIKQTFIKKKIYTS